MKNLKNLLYCSLIIIVVTKIQAQCPIKFPSGGNLCLEGNPTPQNDICFKNNLGNLNLLFNGSNKFNFIGQSNDANNYNCGLGFGRTPDATQDGFRIDYNNISTPYNGSSTYFRSFRNLNYTEFNRQTSPGVFKGILGIDSTTNQGNLLYLFDLNYIKNVQLSSISNGTNYFLNKVGIGLTNPTEMIEVNGNAKFYGNYLKLSPAVNDAVIGRETSGNLVLNSGGGTSSLYLNYASDYNAGSGGINIFDGGKINFAKLWITKGNRIDTSIEKDGGNLVMSPSGGRVIIADINSYLKIPSGNYKLIVQNGILTDKVKVAVINSSNWSDFVFDENYKLMPLNEVEKFITKNQHLPNVPSSGELVKNGLDLGEMQAKQMEKIEELTLYLIEIKKEIELLKKENIELKKEVLTLKK